MEFTPGKFQKLRVDKGFHFGPAQIDLPEGAVLEFDGQTMKYGGRDYAASVLAGAVNAGWVVEVEAPKKDRRPVSAGIKVRPAQPSGKERGEAQEIKAAVEDEVFVGTLGASNAKWKGEAGKVASPASSAKKSGSVNLNFDRTVLLEEGETVRSSDLIKNSGSAKLKFDRTLKLGEGEEVRPSVTITMSESIEDVDYDLPEAPVQSSAGENEDARPVARILSPTKTQITLSDSRQAESKIRALDSGTGRRAKIQKITPPAAKSKEAKVTKPEQPHAIAGEKLEDVLPEAASSGSPETFTWDAKKGHWRERVKQAVEKYGNDPKTLERIYAVESEAVVKNIKSQLARR